jgi:hypothetical protein
MKEIIVLTIIAGLIFIVSVLTLIFGFLKKSKKLKLIALFFFISFASLAGLTGYKFVTKSYNKITRTLKPRTGTEIYNSLFGNPKLDCVKVLNSQDQVIPKIDYAIWLYFETCPKELNRILNLHSFSSETISTKGLEIDGPSANEKWFEPASLGDSILVFTYKKDHYGNGQTIYSSVDSTKVFCIDVLD